MTHTRSALPSLPLSVTCSADPRFAEAITALATRMVTSTGGGQAAGRFADAVTAGVEACFSHLGSARAGALTVELTASETEWEGCLQWPAVPGEGAVFVSVLQTRLGALADRVECGHSGADAFCTVTCARG